MSVRITNGGNSVLAVALVDTGWSGSVMGFDLAQKLGMSAPKRTDPEDLERMFAYDRLELLSSSGNVLCSIGPVWITVSRHPGMKGSFIIGNGLLSFLRFVFSYEKKKRLFDFVCPSGKIPKKFMDEGAILPKSVSLGTPVRFRRGSHSFVKWAEFDTGASTTVVGEDIPRLAGIPRLTQLIRSVTRLAGRGNPASNFRLPFDDIEFLDKSKKLVCRTGPVSVVTTTFFEPDSVRIGRDIMQELKMSFGYPPKDVLFRCMGKSGCGIPRRFSRRWRPA